MSRRSKLERFLELRAFPNAFEKEARILKGRWSFEYFQNDHPLILELACGKGEYTLNLARRYPEINFIGIDIKGARLWKGAKTALEEGLKNVAFIRDYIENLTEYFARNEVDEIWITFPEPHPKKSKADKRLTSPRFLALYCQILKPEGMVHLKTDDPGLYEYTLETLKSGYGKILTAIPDLYNGQPLNDLLTIKTTYEQLHLEAGKKIRYLRFRVAM